MSVAGGSAVKLIWGLAPCTAREPFASCRPGTCMPGTPVLGTHVPQELQGPRWTLHYVCTCLFCCCVVS